MIDPISAVSLPVGAPANVEPAGRRVVTPEEVERFEAALLQPESANDTVEIHALQEIVPQEPLGRVLMDALDYVGNRQAEHVSTIASITEPGASGEPFGLRDLFSLQFELMQLSLQQDLTAKVADKLSQGVQTLFRNQ